MKCYPHNDYYRIEESEIVPKLMIASRLTQQDRQAILTDAEIIQSKINDTHYLTKIL